MASEDSLICPSAQPEMRRLRLIGVVEYGRNEGPRVAYINEDVVADPALLSKAFPASATEVFRLAGTCETTRCSHYDGSQCRLVKRIVNLLEPVVDQLPRCMVRAECRWFRQEGVDACVRCPQVITESWPHSSAYARAATPG